jgi:hypothetical protein
MSVRTFWIILIRILGIWMLLLSLLDIPGIIATIFTFGRGESMFSLLYVLGFLLISIAFYYVVFKILIREPWRLINRLGLMEGIRDETIVIQDHTKAFMTGAFLFSGMLLLIRGVPNLISDIFGEWLASNEDQRFMDNVKIGRSVVEVLFGIALMVNCKAISAYLNKNTTE